MKRIIRSKLEELGWVTWVALLIALVAAMGLVVFGILRPLQLQFERQAVEQSKSYTDASNIALSNYIKEYESPFATEGQRLAILDTMCEIVDRVAQGTVSPRVIRFLSIHGGCEQ